MSQKKGGRLAAGMGLILVGAVGALGAQSAIGGEDQQARPNSVVKPEAVEIERPGAPATARRARQKPQKIRYFTTENEVVTAPGGNDLAGLTCPKGYRAVSAGVLNDALNLRIFHIGMENPVTGAFNTRTMWVGMKNESEFGLGWKPTLVCQNRLKYVTDGSGASR